MKCEYCKETFNPTRPGQRFCVGKSCRQKFHREQNLPGEVTGIRQLKRGGWSVTVKVSNLPDLNIGSRVDFKSDI